MVDALYESDEGAIREQGDLVVITEKVTAWSGTEFYQSEDYIMELDLNQAVRLCNALDDFLVRRGVRRQAPLRSTTETRRSK